MVYENLGIESDLAALFGERIYQKPKFQEMVYENLRIQSNSLHCSARESIKAKFSRNGFENLFIQSNSLHCLVRELMKSQIFRKWIMKI
jgi:hypothetical protein